MIPYGWVNGPWKASDPLNGLSLKTKSLMITIAKLIGAADTASARL